MKRCPKRAGEPPCLADFRGAQPSATWQALRNEKRCCYNEIRAQTRADQGGLCAWCETALTTTNEQIAHFHRGVQSQLPAVGRGPLRSPSGVGAREGAAA